MNYLCCRHCGRILYKGASKIYFDMESEDKLSSVDNAFSQSQVGQLGHFLVLDEESTVNILGVRWCFMQVMYDNVEVGALKALDENGLDITMKNVENSQFLSQDHSPLSNQNTFNETEEMDINENPEEDMFGNVCNTQSASNAAVDMKNSQPMHILKRDALMVEFCGIIWKLLQVNAKEDPSMFFTALVPVDENEEVCGVNLLDVPKTEGPVVLNIPGPHTLDLAGSTEILKSLHILVASMGPGGKDMAFIVRDRNTMF